MPPPLAVDKGAELEPSLDTADTTSAAPVAVDIASNEKNEMTAPNLTG